MNNQSPFDGKALMAIFLVGVMFLGWQWHMSKKYGKPAQAPVTAESATQAPSGAAATIQNTAQNADAKNTAEKPATVLPEKIVENIMPYKDAKLKLAITSYGMGLRDITLEKFKNRDQGVMTILDKNVEPTFSTGSVTSNKPLIFNVQKAGENTFVGTASIDKYKVTKTVRIDPDSYRLFVQVNVSNVDPGFQGLVTHMEDHLAESKGSSMFMPATDVQEVFVVAEGKENRTVLHDKENQQASYSNTTVVSLGTQYFAQAYYDKSGVRPEFQFLSDATNRRIDGRVIHRAINATGEFKTEYQIYLGPKDVSAFIDIDPSMANIVNFGMFSWIGRQILKLLKTVHDFTGNWGIAIIVMTLLVRALLFPLHLMSYKSMEGMKKVQPLIKELREKYKDEPQRMNQEMMVLMKAHKVNPLGGCLPVFLQLPVFFALYQVLGHSIELYQAPFILWIQDLSSKDPFYILPILMGITMVLQMKMTPSTMDPAQQKIMMFMPIVFSVFTLGLPSGLTLYIFISTLFGVIQQLYFLNQTRKSEAALQAKNV